MEFGFARNIPFRKWQVQEENLLRFRPGLRVYALGRGAETLDAIIRAGRNRECVLLLDGGLRILGDTQGEVLATYQRLKAAKFAIMDTTTGERSDRDGVEMQRASAKALQFDKAMGGARKEARRRGRKGGAGKGVKAAAKRAEKMPEDAVRRLVAKIGKKLSWRDVEEITTFSTATIRRHYL